MVQRVTYRRQCSYNTRGNKIKQVKTPGGRLIAHHVAKKVNHNKRAQRSINGIKAVRSFQLKGLSRRDKTVSRPYGGRLSSLELKDRVLRAFLIEEVKIVKKVSKQ